MKNQVSRQEKMTTNQNYQIEVEDPNSKLFTRLSASAPNSFVWDDAIKRWNGPGVRNFLTKSDKQLTNFK